MSVLVRSPLKVAGAVPFKLFVGGAPVVVVAFTDMTMSGVLVGGLVIVGPNKVVTALINTVGVLTAGEFGS
jgi:hypothetical protein